MGKFNDLGHKLGYELLPLQQHSPDFAPSDYILFSNLKKSLGGFTDGMNAQTKAYFRDADKSNYLEGVKTMEKL